MCVLASTDNYKTELKFILDGLMNCEQFSI